MYRYLPFVLERLKKNDVSCMGHIISEKAIFNLIYHRNLHARHCAATYLNGCTRFLQPKHSFSCHQLWIPMRDAKSFIFKNFSTLSLAWSKYQISPKIRIYEITKCTTFTKRENLKYLCFVLPFWKFQIEFRFISCLFIKFPFQKAILIKWIHVIRRNSHHDLLSNAPIF